jgi:hypothetical protein
MCACRMKIAIEIRKESKATSNGCSFPNCQLGGHVKAKGRQADD